MDIGLKAVVLKSNSYKTIFKCYLSIIKKETLEKLQDLKLAYINLGTT